MRIIAVIAGLALLGCVLPEPASCAQAQKAPPSAGSAFKTKFIGEGGGYGHMSPDAADQMETAAQQAGSAYSGSVPQVVERPGFHPKPVSGPLAQPAAPPALHPALTRPRPAAARPAPQASESAAPQPQEADRRRYSLWEGLAAPMELPQQKIGDVSEDQAAAMGRRDYDTHILGERQASAPQRDLRAPGSVLAGSWESRPAVSDAVADAAAKPAPEVFVTLDLDLKNHPDSTLKDAVADLGRVAGFRQDLRFEPSVTGSNAQAIALHGWMHPGRVGAAMAVPAVARLEVSPAARPASPRTATDMLMGVRVAPQRGLAETLSRLEKDLGAPGLKVRRTIGTQTAPGTSETVLVVEASVPVSMLRRLLAHPDVVKMVPAPRAPEAPAAARRPWSQELRRFAGFAAEQSPLLLVLTLLMLLPVVGSGVAAAMRVFVPYR